MNGIDNIVKAILDDAKADVDATQEQTKAQIQQLKDKSKGEVDKQISVLEKETDKKSVELKRREKTILDVEIRRNNLMVKREMVNEAFDIAYNSLCELKAADYAEIVTNMMLNAVESGTEEVVVGNDAKIDQKLIDTINKKLSSEKRAGQLTLSKDKGDFNGGFILRKDGIETNCTFIMLVNQIKPQIESEVANILFD